MSDHGWCVQCGKALTGPEYAWGHKCEVWSGVEGMKITGPIEAFIPGVATPSKPLPEAPVRVVAVDFDRKTITLEISSD